MQAVYIITHDCVQQENLKCICCNIALFTAFLWKRLQLLDVLSIANLYADGSY